MSVKTVSSGYVAALMIAMGLCFCVVLIGAVCLLTYRIDLQTRTDTRVAHAQILHNMADTLRVQTDDYAFWTDALEIVGAGDEQEIYENIGAAATDSLIFDQLFILTSTGEVAHAFGPEGRAADAPSFDAESAAPFLDSLASIEAEDYPIISGLARWHDRMAVVAVARITPYPDLPATLDDLPVLVTLRFLGQSLFDQMRMATRAENFVVSAPSSPQDGLALLGQDGATAGWLAWDPRTPGTALRRDLLLILSLTCAVMLAISLLAARYFHRQAQHLKAVQRIAATDQLTGLLNRAGLQDVLSGPDVRLALEHKHYAVLTLDLNDFKELNDRKGHKAGDFVLTVIANRLTQAIRHDDHAARIGGDEFLCLILDDNPDRAARAAATRIASTMADPIDLGSETVRVSAAIGVAVAKDGLGWERVCDQSDTAMYWAKRKNRGAQPTFFSGEMDAPAA